MATSFLFFLLYNIIVQIYTIFDQYIHQSILAEWPSFLYLFDLNFFIIYFGFFFLSTAAVHIATPIAIPNEIPKNILFMARPNMRPNNTPDEIAVFKSTISPLFYHA
ncbi:hypothetical protein ACUW9Z_001216 [Aerococcus sp. 150760007-1]|uniref:Uncharacterized protein n=1 Tax=Aerococcus urinaeequi TaxID=51665 RepID=A0ABR5ZYI1_9LACT|nr:hypothetical protein [Aerococcus urinaeequi]MBA5746779.1 hypothetical protein [Aerococcus urinaeequi]MBA5829629.1 hypothetical protein [Aerococcus urinaeequi]MBA5860628.1 hypothetical protein [Aerococcus urinaeequi]